jgi:hypothetical protein
MNSSKPTPTVTPAPASSRRFGVYVMSRGGLTTGWGPRHGSGIVIPTHGRPGHGHHV